VGIPTLAYIDGEVIDELWMNLKRDGVAIERLNKAKAVVSGKVTFGVGNLISWLVSDLKGELSGQVDGEETVKRTYAAPFRLLLLLELLPDLKSMKLEDHDILAQLKPNDLVDVDCPRILMLPLPKLGDFAHITLASELMEEQLGQADLTPKDRAELAEKHFNKFSVLPTAFSFWLRLHRDDEKEDKDLARLNHHYPEIVMNMMSLSRDDLILGIAIAERSRPPELVDPEDRKPPSRSEVRRAQMREAEARIRDRAMDALLSPEDREREQAERRRRKADAEAEAKQALEKRRLDLRTNCDALMLTSFAQGNMKQNVAALSATGRRRVFGRIMDNLLKDDTGTRLITVQPITLSIANDAQAEIS
jgi:hypothetical protein